MTLKRQTTYTFQQEMKAEGICLVFTQALSRQLQQEDRQVHRQQEGRSMLLKMQPLLRKIIY